MTSIRGVLSVPQVYEAWSRLVGGAHGRSTLVREHVRPRPGARVLDLGCGPGELVTHLGDVRYVGIDSSEDYIDRARRTWGSRAEFRVGDATQLSSDLRDFDFVLALGVLHHLDDPDAKRLVDQAAAALVPGGRFLSVDPTRASDGHRRVANLLASWDRGRHVRAPAEYRRIVECTFARVQYTIRTDLLRIPYIHCIVEAVKARESPTPPEGPRPRNGRDLGR